MDKNRLILILIGIGIALGFLVGFIDSKSPLDIFGITIGLLVLIIGFYTENKKISVSISYFMAIVSINLIQWLIMGYIFYYNQIYVTTQYFIYLIGTLILTLTLVNQIIKNNLKSSEKTEIRFLKDKTKLILLFTGLVVLIGCLAGFIIYYFSIFLYGITLGLMALIAGFYHENNRLNVSSSYVKAMGSIFILQLFIFVYFIHQFSIDDFANAFSFSLMLLIYFLAQFYNSDSNTAPVISISNKKKEMIIGISAVILFIALFGAFYQTGYIQSNTTEDEGILNSYSVMDTSYNINQNISTQSFSDSRFSFNYPDGWIVDQQENMVIVSKYSDNNDIEMQLEIKSTYGMSEATTIKKYKGNYIFGSSDASYKLKIDNKTAYADTIVYDDGQKSIKSVQIIFVKNNSAYLMYLQAPADEFDKEKGNFAVILNSFKVQ